MARSREVTMGERKYFLDWLRVIAFCLLILFHVGMLYVTWSYNLKSERIFPDLELAMIALSPWRLVLLFFISGVASRFLLEKLSAGGFARDRLRRLLPVILLGIFVIIPPQVYVEMLSKGLVDSGYLEFWFGSYLTSASFPNRTLPTWDHLWFLVYLLFYAHHMMSSGKVYAGIDSDWRCSAW
jgi:glucan biosynthesis protein C